MKGKGDKTEMKKAGIVLIVLEILGIFMGLLRGTIIEELSTGSGISNIIFLIGYLLPGIIGIILVMKANKK